MSANSSARCSALAVGKFDQISPQPRAPSESSTLTNTATRSAMVPKEVRTGSWIGARKTCASILARVADGIYFLAMGSAKSSRLPKGSVTFIARAPHGSSSMPGL